MKNTFGYFYAPTDVELEERLKSGIFAFDASFLLDLYRYSEALTSSMFEALGGLGDRIWIPHQAALEFHKNRLTVLSSVASKHAELAKYLAKESAEVKAKVLEQCERQPQIDPERILQPLLAAMSETTAFIEEARSKQTPLSNRVEDDPVWKKLTVAFEGKVGPPFDDARQQELRKESAARFAERNAPGWRDDKKGDGGIGDFYIWNQLIDKAKTSKKPLFWVTSDVKEDWWLEVSGRKIGAHPHLLREFSDSTGQAVHLYETRNFVTNHWPKLRDDLKAQALAEIEKVQSLKHAELQRALLEATTAHISWMDRLAAEKAASEFMRSSAEQNESLMEQLQKAIRVSSPSFRMEQLREAMRAAVPRSPMEQLQEAMSAAIPRSPMGQLQEAMRAAIPRSPMEQLQEAMRAAIPVSSPLSVQEQLKQALSGYTPGEISIADSSVEPEKDGLDLGLTSIPKKPQE